MVRSWEARKAGCIHPGEALSLNTLPHDGCPPRHPMPLFHRAWPLQPQDGRGRSGLARLCKSAPIELPHLSSLLAYAAASGVGRIPRLWDRALLLGLVQGETDGRAELMEGASRTSLCHNRVLGIPDLPASGNRLQCSRSTGSIQLLCFIGSRPSRGNRRPQGRVL